MIAPVIIDLLVKGAPQVGQAFKGVEAAAMRAERAMQRDADRAAKARVASAQREAKEKIRIWQRGDAETKRIQDRAVRETERAEREKERIVDRHAKAQLRIHQSAQREVERIEERGRAAARRGLQQETRDKEREAAKWVKLREREMRTASASRARFGSAMVGAGAQGVMTGMQRVGSTSMRLAGIAGQLGGGFDIGSSITNEQNLRKRAAVLSANSLLAGAGSDTGAAMSTDAILGKAKAIGIAQNIDPEEVLRGFDEVKKLTGNVEKATQVMPAIAKLATATGGDVSEMSGLAGNILAANPNISNDDLEKQMRIFAKQGVVGGVEVADFAKYGSRITAGASMYGGNKETNEATLGAMAQMARQYGSAGTAAEATLGSLRFSTDIAKHAKTLKGNGIDVSDGKGNLKDAQSVLLEMLDKTKGDVTKLSALGLGERGVKPLEGVANIYKNAGGGAKGREAVQKEFAKYTTGVSKDEIDAANKRVLSEQQTEIEMKKLQLTIGQELLPVFKDMIPALKDMIPALVDAAKIGIPAFTDLMKAVSEFVKGHKGEIEWLAANPIGSLVAFEVTKSFAAAALPDLLRSLMSKAFGGGGTPTPPGGGAGGGTSAAGGATIALGMVAQGYGAYDLVKGTRGAMREGRAAGTDLAARAAAGDQSAQAEIAKAQSDGSGMNVAGAWMQRATRAVSVLTSPGAAAGGYLADAGAKALGAETQDEQSKRALRASEIVDTVALQKATTDAIANGVREGVRQGNSGPSGAGRTVPIIRR